MEFSDTAEAGKGTRVLSILGTPAVPIAGGELGWVPVRRRLGIGSFGANAFRAARRGEVVIEEHVESPGQEELYVVLRGRARLTVGDEVIDADVGTAVFVPDPALRRSGVALEDETVVLALGGWPGRPYHSLPWEPIYLAQEAMRNEDWAAAVEILEREAGEHLDSAFVQFRLASCHARLGENELALRELTRAVEINPAMLERAMGDAEFEALRKLDGWPQPTA